MVRTEKDVSFEELANETGFKVSYLKKLESGEVIPPVGTLLQIARALQIDSAAFLTEKEKSNLEKRISSYKARTKNYAYTTLTPGVENKHLMAFKVLVPLDSKVKRQTYQHEGEEFVYVLSGKVDITVGEHVNKLEQGDCLHFNSGIHHKLKNTGDDDAELLVSIYAP